MFGVVRKKLITTFHGIWLYSKYAAIKFADLSDYSFGAAMLSDSKYGFETHGK